MVCLELILGIICLVAAFTWWYQQKPKNFPPGPVGLPVLGYLPFLGKYPHISAAKLGGKYGSMYSISIGLGQNCIILNDWKSMKEALVDQSDMFSARPQNFLTKKVFKENDIAFTQGELWKEKRRFALHHLRNLGFGKTSMESVITQEVQEVLENINSNIGQKVNISDLLFLPILNIIWGLIAGRRYAMNDQKMLKFSKTLKSFTENMQKCQFISAIPIARFISGGISQRYHSLLKSSDDIEQFATEELQDHAETYKEGVQRDFIDLYLAEIYKHRDSGEPSLAFQDDQLIGTIKDFFGAGVETILHTLSWAFLHMAIWPEIQGKVHQELDEVVGKGRSPVYSDKSLLPYTEAVLLETQRYASIVPFSLPHENKQTTQLMGYTIPKGTYVLPNIWAVHHDPRYWHEPEIYRPERFINDEEKVQKPDYFIPFSVGTRFCLGESLARMELFLFFATILHRYSLHCITGEKPPSLDPVPSIALGPQPFGLVFKHRF